MRHGQNGRARATLRVTATLAAPPAGSISMIEMVFRGTGYNYPDSAADFELMKHRRRHLDAITALARRDDERAELERELAQLDQDIARGVEELDQREARARVGRSPKNKKSRRKR